MLVCSHYSGRSAATLRFFYLESRAVEPDLVLDLPLFQVGSTIVELGVKYSRPPPGMDTDAFHQDPLARLYAVTLAALPPSAEGTETERFAFLVPAYNIIKRLRDRSRTSDRLAWDSWGSSDARAVVIVLSTAILGPGWSSLHCAGLRCACNNQEGDVWIYDLNTSRGSPEIPDVLASWVFVDDVRTHLPCRRAVISREGASHFVLGEDYLALSRVNLIFVLRSNSS
jgi:hypothetical protein